MLWERLYASEAWALMLAMDNMNLRAKLGKYEPVEAEKPPDTVQFVDVDKEKKWVQQLVDELKVAMNNLGLLKTEH